MRYFSQHIKSCHGGMFRLWLGTAVGLEEQNACPCLKEMPVNLVNLPFFLPSETVNHEPLTIFCRRSNLCKDIFQWKRDKVAIFSEISQIMHKSQPFSRLNNTLLFILVHMKLVTNSWRTRQHDFMHVFTVHRLWHSKTTYAFTKPLWIFLFQWLNKTN